MMLKICYVLASLCEAAMAIFVLNKIYPEFRFKSNMMKGVASLLLLVNGFFYVGNAWLFYISISYGLIVSLVTAGIYWLFWKSRFLNNYLFVFFFYINISILKMPLLIIRGIKDSQNIVSVNRGPRIFVEVGCIFVILVLVYIGVTYYKKTIIILQKLFTENMLLCAATTIFEWLILCHCMRNGAERFVKRDLAFNFIVILCVALLLLSISLFFTYQQIKTESMIQMEIQKCLKNQYHELKELYEVNSRWVHDAKHELILVGNCLEENDLSRAHDSVQRYLQRIKQTEKKVWSNFSFVDFMLNYKKAEMDKRNIKFVLRIELQHINIPEEELAIIIGNLLDNAIEAAEKCKESERFIHLKIQNVNHMLLLSVENSCVEQPKIKKGMFISTKTDHGIHGWGLKSVKQIVETYNGEMDFEYDEKHFQVEILI